MSALFSPRGGPGWRWGSASLVLRRSGDVGRCRGLPGARPGPLRHETPIFPGTPGGLPGDPSRDKSEIYPRIPYPLRRPWVLEQRNRQTPLSLQTDAPPAAQSPKRPSSRVSPRLGRAGVRIETRSQSTLAEPFFTESLADPSPRRRIHLASCDGSSFGDRIAARRPNLVESISEAGP